VNETMKDFVTSSIPSLRIHTKTNSSKIAGFTQINWMMHLYLSKITFLRISLPVLIWLFLPVCIMERGFSLREDNIEMDKKGLQDLLRDHVKTLTHTIGERSVRRPENIERAATYIQSQFEAFGLKAESQTYRYRDQHVRNIVADLPLSSGPARRYVLGAHYDSVSGTVGADDNASAVAVMLETARIMQARALHATEDRQLTFVAFTLEEPPAYGTEHMGSRVFAARAKQEGQVIDGMICLEMVGYTCREPGCQHYPFPLQFLGYPKEGTFIGIVGNVNSLRFSRELRDSFRSNPNLPVVSLTVPFDGWILPAVRLSDHASFWSKGYRAVMVTDSAYFRNPHYHTPSDTMETLDFSFMAELVMNLVAFFSSKSF
jgi:hypothetical protein